MYDYQVERPKLFTEEGQEAVIKARDHALEILEESGVITMIKAMSAYNLGDAWCNMAVVDRLVEMGDLVEVDHGNGECPAQYRIFRGRTW